MPKGGNWTTLKQDTNKFFRKDIAAKDLIKKYIETYGGFEKLIKGSSSGGGGGKGKDTNVLEAVNRVGHFFNTVANNGLTEALKQEGLNSLIGKDANEIYSGLLEAFATNSNTLDEIIVRTALGDLLLELFSDNLEYSALDEAFNDKIDFEEVQNIIGLFMGYYIYELFCRDFYEDWANKIGTDKANMELKEVKESAFMLIKLNFDKKKNINLSTYKIEQIIDKTVSDIKEIFEA